MEQKGPQSGIKLIAKLANVSIGTVDRVLHNRPGVAEETKKRVLKIIEELDYKPNIIARRLVSKKKYTFAVIIPSSSEDNPYWDLHEPGIKKAEDEISPLGIFIERFYFNQNDPKSFREKINKVIKGNFDGVLLVPFFEDETTELINHCSKVNIPYVFFDTNLRKKSQALSYIGQDAFKSGIFAGRFMSYMLSKSDTILAVNINAIKKADNHINYLQRASGLKELISQSGSFHLKFFDYSNIDQENNISLEEKLLSTLKDNPDIKVIFVTNSRAYKVAAILEKNKIKNLRLIGYDLVYPNIEFMQKGYIDFLISQEPYQQGYSGIMSLYTHLILNNEVEKENLMPITLIMKENLEYYKG